MESKWKIFKAENFLVENIVKVMLINEQKVGSLPGVFGVNRCSQENFFKISLKRLKKIGQKKN